MNSGALDRIFNALCDEGIIDVNLEVLSIDSTSIRVHPAAGALKKMGHSRIGRSRGGLTIRLHAIAADDRTPVIFDLSPCQLHDGLQVRKLLEKLEPVEVKAYLVMDKAYESSQTRRLTVEMGFIPVVAPERSRKAP